MASELSAEVVEAAVTACGRAFHLKHPLKALFLAQGVPASMWDRYASEGVSKYTIARNVFSDLEGRGSSGDVILRKIITELANLSRPHPSVEDKSAGQTALKDLRDLAVARRILQDPDAAARRERERKLQIRERERSVRTERLGDLARRVATLASPGSDAQARGYALERVLADLFQLNEMVYRPSYRVEHEQFDGAFDHRGFHYLVEARWRTASPTFGDLADFKGKVDSKLESTRGVFVSMVGFDEDVVSHFMAGARGTRNNLILFDGQDLVAILEGSIELGEALDYKIGKAAQEAVWWAPLVRRFG